DVEADHRRDRRARVLDHGGGARRPDAPAPVRRGDPDALELAGGTRDGADLGLEQHLAVVDPGQRVPGPHQLGHPRAVAGPAVDAGPTIVGHRRPARRARSAKAAAAARSAPGTAKGIRLAPARQTASSSRPGPKPQSGAPRAAAAVPLDSTRPASTQAATG